MFKRKIVAIVSVVLIVLSALLCFAACNEGDRSEKDVTVYIGDKTFEASTTADNLHDLLKELKDADKITRYEFTVSATGAFITQIDELMQDATNGKYYYVWHDVDEFALKSVYQEEFAAYNPSRSEVTEEDGTKFVTTSFKGLKLYWSGVGVSSVPLKDGGHYAVLVD